MASAAPDVERISQTWPCGPTKQAKGIRRHDAPGRTAPSKEPRLPLETISLKVPKSSVPKSAKTPNITKHETPCHQTRFVRKAFFEASPASDSFEVSIRSADIA
jgi:hypothetical protein